MKKIINAVELVEDQMIAGMCKAYPQYVTKLDCGNVVVRTNKKEGKPLLTRLNIHANKVNGLFNKRKQSLITIFLKVKIVQLQWEFLVLIVNLKM